MMQMEMTGKNPEDAISRALDKLGLDRDDVSVEVLELGKTGFLGIGSVPAKVKVTYETSDPDPDPVPEPVVKPAPEKPAVKEPQFTKPAREPKPAKERKPAKAPAEPKPGKEPKPAKGPKQPAPAASDGEKGDDAGEQIAQFLTGLFGHMGVDAVPQVTRDGDVYDVVLQGEDLGALIGRRGETLDAIQQLTGYAVNKGRTKRVRVHVDAENYRARREESLRRLAGKVAGKVTRYRRSVTLEAMNAYERHVIHAALQDHPNVTTHSVGTEPNRRVVVSYDPEK